MPAVNPIAMVKAYRRTGGAVVTVERPGRPKHRYCVSLKRYHALREWAAFGDYPWEKSGGWMRSSFTAYFWPVRFRCVCGEMHTLGGGHVCRTAVGKGGATNHTR